MNLGKKFAETKQAAIILAYIHCMHLFVIKKNSLTDSSFPQMHIFVLLACCSCFLSFAVAAAAEILPLTDALFEDHLQSHEFTFVMFYAPWYAEKEAK